MQVHHLHLIETQIFLRYHNVFLEVLNTFVVIDVKQFGVVLFVVAPSINALRATLESLDHFFPSEERVKVMFFNNA
jgi:hypothetical protein